MKKLTRDEKLKLLAYKREKQIRKSRDSFWEFCKTSAPKFYKPDRPFLKKYCNLLQDFYERKLLKPDGTPYTKLMVNVPPRHGKSRTLTLFAAWVLGKNQEEKIITASYSDDLATTFSENTRNTIGEEKNQPHEIVFKDIFIKVELKYGASSKKKWALDGQFFNYKGAGMGGGITGNGGTILIVDDPIKNAEEAYNETLLQKQWDWYTNTFSSRLEDNGLEIVNMTRWSDNDICGRLKTLEPDEWYEFKFEAKDKEENMLCPQILSKERYYVLKGRMDIAIFMANYHQTPVNIKGRLYSSFKTYTELPPYLERIISYTDTADEGNDYLCTVIGGQYEGEIWILDILYTKDGMEITEPLTAEILVRNKVNYAKIESNNGGRGFARNVEQLIWNQYKTRAVEIDWFHQSDNKKSRILSGSTYIINHVYFPWNWKDRWPEYYLAMTAFQKEGKNKNDDAPDATTGLCEMVTNSDEITYGTMKLG